MLESFDRTILLGFTEEAQSYLPAIRRGISDFQADHAQTEGLQLAYRHTHTIRGASLMVGLPELSELAGRVEIVLENCVVTPEILSPEKITEVTDALNIIENLLTETIAALREEILAKTDDSFGDEMDFSFEPEKPAVNAQTDDNTAFDEDLDPEMLEVFALEAEDLLRNIGDNLRLLEQNAQDSQALREIRRSSHTLKGAAGVVGFRTVSRLAHRIEDLLDYLAENPAASNAETTALVLASTDVLENLTRGAGESALQTEIDRLYARFDSVLTNALAESDIQPTSPLPAETSQNYEHTDEQTNFIASPEDTELLAPSSAMSPSPAPPVAQSAAQRAVVRVGLERLDEIVKLMGELIISRTTLEQRLAEVEAQLSELGRSTKRLRRIAGKLEIDYEAEMLGGGQAGAKSFVPQFLAATAVPIKNSAKHGFDELEFDRYTEFHQLTRELVETSGDAAAIENSLNDAVSSLESVLARQRRTTEEMQEKLMALRMVSLQTLATRLERTVRVVAEQEGKQAEFYLQSNNVELDTQVMDALIEPLLHLLRNAVAHGIEPSEERVYFGKHERGVVYMSAHHEGTYIVITISDDGRGLNLARLREKAVKNGFLTREAALALSDEEAAELMFLPGLSTAREISEVSGRGVGMDIVKESVVRQQGTIALHSEPGEGTTFTIRLPMSITVTRALLVKAFGSTFAVPVGMISQLTEVAAEDLNDLTNEKTLLINDAFYRVYSLNSLLQLPELTEREASHIPVLLIGTGEAKTALTLDRIVEAREIVIKPFDALLRGVRGIMGATVLGDGSVVPILDLFALIETQKAKRPLNITTVVKELPPQINPQSAIRHSPLTVMIVDDSPSVRRVMTNLITKAGWNSLAAKDGLEAIEMLQVARHLPQVILSDVEMPRMDGYELIATLKQQENLREIPVVMITSRAGEKHRRKALDMGASEYVTKPYQDSVLLETIQSLVR